MLTDFKGKNWISKTPAEFVRKLIVRNKGNIPAPPMFRKQNCYPKQFLMKSLWKDWNFISIQFYFRQCCHIFSITLHNHNISLLWFSATLLNFYTFQKQNYREQYLIFSQSWKVENCLLKVNPGYKIQTNFVLAVASKQANPGIPVTSGLSSILLIT